MKKLTFTALIMIFLNSCSGDENDIIRNSRLKCRDLIPMYTPNDTLFFASIAGGVRKMRVASVIDTSYRYNHENFELYEIKFQRINDNRVFRYNRYTRIYFQDARLSLDWEGCFSGLDLCPQKNFVNQMVVNGKTYTSCITMSRFCGDTANPIQVIYDIKEGIVSYTDSSGTRWDLVPK